MSNECAKCTKVSGLLSSDTYKGVFISASASGFRPKKLETGNCLTYSTGMFANLIQKKTNIFSLHDHNKNTASCTMLQYFRKTVTTQQGYKANYRGSDLKHQSSNSPKRSSMMPPSKTSGTIVKTPFAPSLLQNHKSHHN